MGVIFKPMKKVTDYALVRVFPTKIFNTQADVAKALKNGWVPHGSPVADEYNTYQAFVKYEIPKLSEQPKEEVEINAYNPSPLVH